MKFFSKAFLYFVLLAAVFAIFQILINIISPYDAQANWAWYLSRSSGILAYIFLWLTIFLGLSIRNPLLKNFVARVYSFDLHCFMGAASVFWTLIHGSSLLFDQMANLNLGDLFIPFYSHTTIVDPYYMSFGIIAFYLLAIMTVTSYLKKHLKNWLWRVLHFLNPVAFVFVVFHGLYNGTDINGNIFIGGIYLFSAFILVIIYLTSLIAAIVGRIRKSDNFSN